MREQLHLVFEDVSEVRRHGVKGLVAILLAGVGFAWPATVRADQETPRWLVLQIDQVSVTAQRPGGAGAWDAPKQKDGGDLLCSLVGGGAD